MEKTPIAASRRRHLARRHGALQRFNFMQTLRVGVQLQRKQ